MSADPESDVVAQEEGRAKEEEEAEAQSSQRQLRADDSGTTIPVSSMITKEEPSDISTPTNGVLMTKSTRKDGVGNQIVTDAALEDRGSDKGKLAVGIQLAEDTSNEDERHVVRGRGTDDEDVPPRPEGLERGADLMNPLYVGAFAMDNADIAQATEPGAYEAISAIDTTTDTASHHHHNNSTEGLVVANVVEEGDQGMVVAPYQEARQVDLEEQRRQSQQQNTKQLHETFRYMGIGLLLLIALSVTIFMPLVMIKSETEEQSSSASNHNVNGDLKTEGMMDDPEALVLPLLPEYTLPLLTNPSSPQSMAMEWILQDPNLVEYPSFRILQRYALATFYFSTGGGEWLDTTSNSNASNKNHNDANNPWGVLHDRWLSYEHHECDWATRPSTNELADVFIPENHPLTPLMEGRPCVGWNNNTRIPIEEENDQATAVVGTYQDLWLWQNNLKGTLPEEFFLLSSLRSVGLAFNNLDGTVSTRMAQLTDLLVWDVAFCRLTGTIPTQIGQLTHLNATFFPGNSLTGPLPSQLGLLSLNTRILMLDSNHLTGTIPNELQYLSSLWWLYLQNNQLSGTLPTGLGKLVTLDKLEIGGNLFSGTIPSELGLLTVLKRLKCQKALLSGTIPTELRQIPLEGLNFYSNKLTGRLPGFLFEMDSLKSVLLYDNEFHGSIPTTVGLLTALKQLRLSHNELTSTLATEIGLLTNLGKRLYLDHNQLTGPIPAELSNIPIKDLQLSDNNFSGQLPSELGVMSNLVTLNLGNNSLSGPIPSELGLLNASLSSLFLGGNLLTGTIPEEIGALAIHGGLSELDVTGNPFLTGSLPPDLCAIDPIALHFDCNPVEGLCGCNCGCVAAGASKNSSSSGPVDNNSTLKEEEDVTKKAARR